MIKIKIVTPNGVYDELEASQINFRCTDGDRGLLPNHMPIVFILEISRLELIINGKRKQYSIAGGMLYFENNFATILVDAIESQEDIDVERAKAAKERAEGRINGKDPNIDLKRAEIALHRALNRLSVSSY